MSLKTDTDTPPLFFFVRGSDLVEVYDPEAQWCSKLCVKCQSMHPNLQMWAFRYGSWIRFAPYKESFDIMEDFQAPNCLKLVELVQ